MRSQLKSRGLRVPCTGTPRDSTASPVTELGTRPIRAAIDRFSGAGFVSKLDMKQESWKQPKGGVGDQAAGAAFYLGWYNLGNFQDIFGNRAWPGEPSHGTSPAGKPRISGTRPASSGASI